MTVERVLLRAFVKASNLTYAVLKLLPVRHKVVFITWDSNRVTLDFRLLAERLAALPHPPKTVMLCRELRPGVLNYISYFFHMLRQMYEMATSEVLVLDAYCVLASILKHRPSLRVVQIWHALGSFKKFGWSIVDKSEGWSAQSNIPSRTLAGILHMHEGYTAGVVSYSGAIPHFTDAFHADPSIFHVAWLPRVDALRDEEMVSNLRHHIIAAHPELAGHKVVLYAPTIRRTAMDTAPIIALVDAIAGVDWALIVKPHPVRGEKPRAVFPEQAVNAPDFSALQLLTLADAVITDYSAIAYEAYLRDIPVYFYAHDIHEYEQARGFYVPPTEFPSTIYSTPDQLVADMVAGVADHDAMRRFVDVFLEDSDRRVDIVDLINPDKPLP
ncbi:MAG: CDP-glycerol glycerophosphotransferase family protein [Propionibacteriaceae bacterium]|nr:CDP-glycerol glycerophosphotransferase family protein [Propionibacteriaceae bacterium]